MSNINIIRVVDSKDPAVMNTVYGVGVTYGKGIREAVYKVATAADRIFYSKGTEVVTVPKSSWWERLKLWIRGYRNNVAPLDVAFLCGIIAEPKPNPAAPPSAPIPIPSRRVHRASVATTVDRGSSLVASSARQRTESSASSTDDLAGRGLEEYHIYQLRTLGFKRDQAEKELDILRRTFGTEEKISAVLDGAQRLILGSFFLNVPTDSDVLTAGDRYWMAQWVLGLSRSPS